MNYTLKTAVLAILIAFAVNVFICPIFIPFLRRIKFGQNVRSDGPATHLKKSGTPTMGGITILVSFVVSSAFFLKDNPEAMLVVFATMAFGVVGFVDDYIKVVMKRSLGLKAWQKIMMQLIIIAIFLYFLFRLDNNLSSYSTIIIPFLGISWDMGWLYIPFIVFFMIGFVNAVNLTDGLDGLASGVTALVATFFFFSAWAVKSGVLPITGAAVGSLLGFLLFNTYPAKVFLGDTGSLALGGLVASVAIVLKMPLFLVIAGFIYVAEAFSVIIQVAYFKRTKGRRFFKMAPLHHHFELSGMEETKVVAVFYIATAILCLIAYLGNGSIF